MIDEAELRTILTTTAEGYEVPASGPERVRSAIRQQAEAPTPEPLPNESWAGRVRRTSGGHRTVLTLAGVAAAILLVGLVVVNVGRDSRSAVDRVREAAPSRPELVSRRRPLRAHGRRRPRQLPSALRGMEQHPAPAPRRGQPTPKAGSAAKNATAKDQVGSEKIVKTGSIDLQVPRGTFSDRIGRLPRARAQVSVVSWRRPARANRAPHRPDRSRSACPPTASKTCSSRPASSARSSRPRPAPRT